MGAPRIERRADGAKWCCSCEAWKVEEAFNKNANARDGRCSWCRDCMSAHRKRWRAENPQRTSDYNQRYRRAQREGLTAPHVKAMLRKTIKGAITPELMEAQRSAVAERRRLNSLKAAALNRAPE